jgi:hypothetical protein
MIIDACVEGKSLGACSIVYCLVDGIIAAADQLLYHKYAEIKCFDRQEHTLELCNESNITRYLRVTNANAYNVITNASPCRYLLRTSTRK